MTTTFSNASREPAKVASTTLELAKLASRCAEPDVTVNELLRVLAREAGFDQVGVLSPDRSSGKLRVSYRHGGVDGQAFPGEGPANEGIGARVMSTSHIALLPRGAQASSSAYRVLDPRGTDYDIDNIGVVAVPLMQCDQPIGALIATSGGPQRLPAKDVLYLLQMAALLIGQALRLGDTTQAKVTSAAMPYEGDLKRASTVEGRVYGILGYSPALRKSIDKALRASQSDATVLMVGESGSGKERFARMVHLASSRCDGPFVCVNCAAIPPDLLESELFGHEKGAFTGATSTRQGKFELANKGTLFLDEIGDMNLDLQAKLLRALQEKVVQRVGGTQEIATDVRIIAATNRNLEELIRNETFRLDLYFRLNVLKVQLPALRERRSDIRMLALYFLTRENHRYRRNLVLTGSALERLENYDWPGNVRQLENVIERLVIMAETELVFAEEIDQLLKDELVLDGHAVVPIVAGGAQRMSHIAEEDEAEQPVRPYQRVDALDSGEIVKAITSAKGNKTLAARSLGLTPRQLHYRLSKLGLREHY